MLATISIDLRKIVPLKDTFVLNQMIKSPGELVAKDSQEVTSGSCLDEMKTCPHTVPFRKRLATVN